MLNSTELYGLVKWTSYSFRLFGATSKGEGLISANITIKTDEDSMYMIRFIFLIKFP